MNKPVDYYKTRVSQTQKVGQIMDKIIKINKLSQGIDQVRIREIWKQVGGVALFNYTQNIVLKEGKLFITLSSSSLRNELSLKKNNLVTLLNESYGKEVVSEIFFK